MLTRTALEENGDTPDSILPVYNAGRAAANATWRNGTNVPILHLNGDRDISFPVENWYALNGQFPTLSLITYPRAGHAAHFQYPELAAAHIAAFIKDTKKA